MPLLLLSSLMAKCLPSCHISLVYLLFLTSSGTLCFPRFQSCPSPQVFFLYDSKGFPVDLTQRMAEESGLTVDIAGYNAAMEEQREKGRVSRRLVASWYLSTHNCFLTLFVIIVRCLDTSFAESPLGDERRP